MEHAKTAVKEWMCSKKEDDVDNPCPEKEYRKMVLGDSPSRECVGDGNGNGNGP